MKQHPIMGAELLKLADTFPEQAQSIVLNHHEYLDGSGYPKGLKKDSLSKLDQLVTAINLYDTLCHPEGRNKAKTPMQPSGLYIKTIKKNSIKKW